MKLPVHVVLALGVLLFSFLPAACSQPDRCERVKKEAFDFNPNSPASLKEMSAKLESCGYDEMDFRVAAPFIANLILQRKQLTFGDVISVLELVKRQPWYLASRRKMEAEDAQRARMPIAPPPVPDYTGLCGEPLNPDSLSFDFPLPHYYDYKQALKCGQQTGKRLMLYFTGINNALGRMLEKRVLSDPEVKALLQQDYIIVLLPEDVGSGADRNIAMEERYGSNATPAIMLLDQNEKVLDKIIGLVDKEAFLSRLQAHAK